MAFYFSKNNFEAASKSNQELLSKLNTKEEKLSKTLAKDVMIPKEQIVYYDFEKDKDKSLKEIVQDDHYNRYVFFESNTV